MKKFPILAKLKSLRTDVDSLNDSIASISENYTLLFDFTGTSQTDVTIPGSKNIDEYKMLQFVLSDSTDTEIISAVLVNSKVSRGRPHKIYAYSNSVWASFHYSKDSKVFRLNRTSSTTGRFQCFGID
jgi:hypothetical protein